MTRTALILAAHGAHDCPDANQIIREWASVIQKRFDQRNGRTPNPTPANGKNESPTASGSSAGYHWQLAANVFKENDFPSIPQPTTNRINSERFDFVIAAFNQGSPRFCEVLDVLLAIDRAVVVPVMTSDGYFAGQFLPNELKKNRRANEVELFLARPLGTHPAIPEMVATRIVQLATEHQFNLKKTTILIVGHGTQRAIQSNRTTIDLVEQLANRFAQTCVQPAFLDQEPLLEDVWKSTDTDDVMVIPFLISPGPHATIDIPNRLGFPENNNAIAIGGNERSEQDREVTAETRAATLNANKTGARRERSESTPASICTNSVINLSKNQPLIHHYNQRRILIDRPIGIDPNMIDCIIELAQQRMTGVARIEPNRQEGKVPLNQGCHWQLAANGSETGCVYLVGAGPGDPDLITIRGAKLINRADAIVYDRLIDPAILAYAGKHAQKINVGKQPNGTGASQEHINKSLVRLARSGKCVVRLKGGDPFVFGRGFEELEACRRAGVPCFVIPGVSSAIAAPSAAGIPVTHRRVARSVAIVTATSADGEETALDFDALAQIDTVIVLMGRANIQETVSSLIAAGKAPQTPAACIENATLPHQRVLRAELKTIPDEVASAEFRAPVVTIVGDVAALPNIEDALPIGALVG